MYGNNDEHEKNKILIVDNDRSHILILSNILKPLYSIFAAKDGKTAVKIAKENTPDLILLDVVMPDMTGYEVFAALKNHENTSRIPVMFITGLDGIEEEEKGFELGAVDYITKPFKDAIVRARVKTQLQIVEYIRQIESFGRTDLLTQIHNRRSFEMQINTEWYRALREKEPLSMLMIDIDHFKKYNDTYGHIQGDEALREVADIFKRTSKRRTDFISRWGGEEFALLLPGTDLHGALELAEAIRVNVENSLIPCIEEARKGENTSITVSVGVNTKMPCENDSVTEFIFSADKALYTAKNTGRNRVCHE